jgi:hypothetical protein
MAKSCTHTHTHAQMHPLRLQPAPPPPPRPSPFLSAVLGGTSCKPPPGPVGDLLCSGRGEEREGHITKARKNKLDNQKNYSNCFQGFSLPHPTRLHSPAPSRAFCLSGILGLSDRPLPQVPPLLSPLARSLARAIPRSLPGFSGVLERSAEYDE